MCRLLIIDDNPIEHLILQRMIDSGNLFQHVSHSSDARVQIESLRENSSFNDKLPDLIFLDLHMPDFNGWEFLKHFKELIPLFNKTVDVYIVSSSIDPSDFSRSKNYPFVKSFVSKPFSKQTLNDTYLRYSAA
ncbi:response regulator [Mucilaginibacter sp. AW1-7]|uniref:response regulator n=1 Tax=Mucilaginibacter sp. AW1-7 TaxID=3349874 RepID=UPI003F737EB5